MSQVLSKDPTRSHGKTLELPAINRYKSHSTIKRKLEFDSPVSKFGKLDAGRLKSSVKVRDEMSHYKQLFINPKIEEFKLKFNDSTTKRQDNTEREVKLTLDASTEKDMTQQIDNALILLDDISDLPKRSTNVYNEQIKMEPPLLQNGIVALMQPTGNSYAPSVPLIHLLKENKSVLRDLLIRSKAGLGMDDLQKESHLSFYLATIYENKQMLGTAIKFYKRFVNYAKRMEDRIGVALGANRIGINEYNRGKYESSLAHHEENTKLSDVENRFTGLYNIGISYRKLDNLEEAINSFESALNWAIDRQDAESTCLCYGQLATTYLQMEQYQQSLQNYEKCLHYAKLLKKTQLQLQSLNAISQITYRLGLRSSENEERILKESLKCSLETGNHISYGLSLCNLGIIRGKRRYEEYKEMALKELTLD